MAIELTRIVEWLNGWFPLRGTETRSLSEVVSATNTSLDNKVNVSQNEANKNMVTNGSGVVITQSIDTNPTQNSNNMVKSGGVYSALSGKIDTAGTGLSKSGTTLNHSSSIKPETSPIFTKVAYNGQGHITSILPVEGNDLPQHGHSTDLIADTTAQGYSNIGTNGPATQQAINGAIDAAIGNLKSFKAIEVVSTKPTPRAETMNKLYIVVETINQQQKVNVYYTKQNGSTYELVKLDDNILDEFSISWSEVTGKPFTNVDTATNTNSTNPITNKAITTALNGKANTNHTHAVTNVGDDPQNIYVPPNADYTVVRNTSGQPLPLDIVLQGFGNYMNNLNNSKITSIALISKATDNTGTIRFYQGDEPSNS